jgi:hypothetical protein
MKAPLVLLFVSIVGFFASPRSALSWSQPHQAITKAALETLPPWQQELLGNELNLLGEDYCLIPDHVFTDRANAKFAMMDDKPKEIYRLNLHLPAQQPENLETLHYFFEKAVSAVLSQNIKDAARYMGTVCHQIEDYGSPSHTMPGDNMFTLLQQFLPPTDAMRDTLLHSPVESGELSVSIPGYKPRLLGTSVREASWKLMHRIHEGIINARSTTIPIIQALYAQDPKTVESQQLKAAKVDTEIVADALYTILSLGKKSSSELATSDEGAVLKTTPVGSFYPLEAASLYYPQTQFFSAPHWGHPRSGVVLAEGKRAMPLKLKIATNTNMIEKEFTNGISAGMGRSLTFLLPPEVFSRFTVFAGLHPELGSEGKVEFSVSAHGKTLASATVGGNEPACALECDLNGVTELQLTLTSGGAAPKSNYAIWGEPLLWKP